MKNKLYFFILAVAPACAIAQPTVNNAFNFTAGATVKNIRCVDIGPGNAGANQTWDFTALTPLSAGKDTARYWYNTPGTGAPVSGANLVEKNSDSFYIYYKKTTAQDEVLAIADSSAANQNFTVKYTNSILTMKRPLTFGMNFSDNFAEQYAIQYMGNTINLKGSGTINVKVDGYGTLKLPGGQTYNDVLRVEVLQQQSDTVLILGNVATLDVTRYFWFDDNHKAPLMRIDAVDITSDAINSSTSYTEYLHKEHDPVGIAEIAKQQMQLAAAFSGNQLHVNGTFETGKEYEVAVYNFSGQKVFQQSFNGNKGKQSFEMNNALPAGMYLVSVTDLANARVADVIKVSKL